MVPKSLSYRIAEFAVACLGPKRVFRLNARELGVCLEKNRRRPPPEPPAFINRKHTLCRESVAGRPCPVIMPKGGGGVNGGAVLFIHGGGYIFETHPVHWRAASLLAARLRVPVWCPAYPLFPDNTISDAVAMITGAYRRMLEKYPATGITVLGDSAGAALALSLCHHIKQQEKELPLPCKLVLLSPAMIVEDDPEIVREMRRREAGDLMLSVTFMDSMRELFGLEAGKDNYCHCSFHGDFSRFPPVHIFSGSGECVFPQVEAFVARLRAAAVPVGFYPGDGMMHIWPYLPLAPECRKALNQVFDIIAQD